MSALPLLLLLLFSSIVIPAAAHGGAEMKPAEVAGEKPHPAGQESYVQKHMASEHHIGAFDMGSFFALHDLDRNGILDVSSFDGRGSPSSHSRVNRADIRSFLLIYFQ